MNVGLVIYGSLNTLSGGYLYDRKLVRYLQNQGDRVEIISLPWRNYRSHLGDNWSRSLRRRLVESRLDILLQDELNHPSLFWLNRHLQRRQRYPLVSIVHHLRSCERHAPGLRFVYEWLERLYLQTVDAGICNSHTTRAALYALLAQRSPRRPPTLVAYPGGDRLRSHHFAAGWRPAPAPSQALNILFVGNLIPRKGLHTLLTALALLPEASVHLHIVGNPEVDPVYARRIRWQIEHDGLGERTTLHGRLDDRSLACLWRQCHLLAVPSTYEGFGIVYVEAMGFGLPAIGTRAGAATEIIRNGENGFVIEPDDATMLAERLRLLNRDRRRLEAMSRAAFHSYLSRPTWTETMARVRRFILQQVEAWS